MKSVILINLLAFTSLPLWSQKTANNLPDSSGYFLLIKGYDYGGGRIISKGDRITVKLRSDKMVRGNVTEINSDYILINSGEKIEINNIKWLRKNKPKAMKIITGVLCIAGGTALLYQLYGTEQVDLGGVPFHFLAGTGLIITGIVILWPTKYKLQKTRYKLIYKDR